MLRTSLFLTALALLLIGRHAQAQATVIDLARVPISLEDVSRNAERMEANAAKRTVAWKAYLAYLDSYDSLWMDYGPALEEYRRAEAGPLILRSSSEIEQGRARLATLEQRADKFDQQLVADLLAADVCDDHCGRVLIAGAKLRALRGEARRYLHCVNPAVCWDAEAAIDQLSLDATDLAALAPFRDAYAAQLLVAFTDLHSLASSMFLDAARVLESKGWKAGANGGLRQTISASTTLGETEVETNVWIELSPRIMAAARRVERLHWEFVFATCSMLSVQSRLSFLGGALLAMSSRVDDGSVERVLLKSMPALAKNGGDACERLVAEHLDRKLPLLRELSARLSEVRAQRSMFTFGMVNAKDVDKLESTSRKVAELNRDSIAALNQLDPRLEAEFTPPTPMDEWRKEEVTSWAWRPSEGHWTPKCEGGRPPLASLPVRTELPGTIVSEAASVASAEQVARFTRLLEEWNGLLREVETSSTTVYDRELAEGYCRQELDYIDKTWTIELGMLNERSEGSASGLQQRARVDFLLDRCRTVIQDPFGWPGGGWRFNLLERLADAGEGEGWIRTEYLKRVLPLLEERQRAWIQWRKGDLQVKVIDGPVGRIFARGLLDVPEARETVRCREGVCLKLGDAEAGLRTAQNAVVRETQRILSEAAERWAALAANLIAELNSFQVPSELMAELERCIEARVRSGAEQESRSTEPPIAPELTARLIRLESSTARAVLARLDRPFPAEGVARPECWDNVMAAELSQALAMKWADFQRDQLRYACQWLDHGSGD